MPEGMYVALSGMESQERLVEIISQNLANASTSGYKKMKPVFRMVAPPPVTADPGDGTPSVAPISSLKFQLVESTSTDFAQGSIIHTGSENDVAIEGEGFYQVFAPDGVRYTRRGNFHIDGQGYLSTTEGYAVSGQGGKVSLNPTKPFNIDEDGAITQDGQAVEKLKVMKFPAPPKAVREGEGYFSYPEQPAPAGKYRIVQGALEQSNVNIVRDMTELISAMRAYEGFQKFIRNSEDINARVTNELGKV